MDHLQLEGQALLGVDFPLALDIPFSSRQAEVAGVTRGMLRRLTRDGFVRRVIKGIYVAAQVPDTLLLRARALALAAPPDAVVVDWTACWLHSGMQSFGQHLALPPVSVFRPPGTGRLRNGLTASGERALLPEDVMSVEGVRVTTPLRTAWDIGRLSRRDDAISGLDRLLRVGGFTREELLEGVERFRRQRGVVQLRELAPLADARAESGGESVLRLRWLDLPSLPPPTPQVPVAGPGGSTYWLDLGVEDLRFAVEYDGEEFHSDDADVEHDRRRRSWISENRRWLIEPVRRTNVFGATRDVERILYEGIATARRELGRWHRRH